MLAETADRTFHPDRLVKLRNYQLVDNFAGVVGVPVSACRAAGQVALEAIAAVEELANILPDIVLDQELAARVVVEKARDVEDVLIQNDELLPSGHFIFEFRNCH